MNKKYLWTLAAAATLIATVWITVSRVPNQEVSDLDQQDLRPSQSATGSDLIVTETKLAEARPAVERIDGYLGSEACKRCHEDYHQSWHTSYHRTMTQLVTPETAPAVLFDSSVEVRGDHYKFSRKGDDFFVELNDPIADGKRLTRRLVLMTGSHHMHVFWYESGYDQTPAQLQIMYILGLQRWVPRTSAFLRPPTMEKESELGRWNGICCQCHSTHPRTRPDEDQISWDTRVIDFGISCEACHGPGESHVAFHQPSTSIATQGSDPIVNPKDLPPSSRSDMCGQCHGMMMVNIEDAADQERFFTEGRQFRPGDHLNDAHFLKVVRASKEHRDSEVFRKFNAHSGATLGHFWPDGEMRVTGRDYTGMIESKCFQQGELSCLSCHTMHQQDKQLQSQWKDDQLMPNMRTDAACLQCHPKYQELGSEHTHHPVDSEGSRCMNCHMPHSIYGILKTSRSHTISSPSVATTIETGRPNACSLCHLDHTLEQTSNHLADWYGHEKPKLTSDEQTVAASLLHFLSGDAAQRVLQVNAFQWPPAQEASGTEWLRIFLLLGMEDPYDAIRLISQRGYQTIPNAPPLDYDFLDSPQDREDVFGKEYRLLFNQRQTPNPALLINSQGRFDEQRFEALMSRRNHRPVYLQE